MHLEWQAHYLGIGRQQTQLLWFIGCFTLSLCTSSHLRYHWKIHCLDVFLIEPLVDFHCYLSPSTCCELAIKLFDPENSLEFGMPIATGAIQGRLYDSHRIPHRTKVLYFTATIHLVQLPCCGRQQFQGYKNQRFDSLLNLSNSLHVMSLVSYVKQCATAVSAKVLVGSVKLL